MANQLVMAKIHAILTLRWQDWSDRLITRTLGFIAIRPGGTSS